ncbi:MAG: nucleotidyltransferase domain-containing protein [Deltaproteobacteria bacterium]|nr:nucleotidyltransferase domain-containing protein [Deltaproteobacteria bacterium]
MKSKIVKSDSKISGIEDQYAGQILDLFKPLPKGVGLILFGSRAKGNYREGSDIDIAITGDNVTLKDRDHWLLKYDNLNLPWKLDLVVYHLIEESALQSHIDRIGVRIL